ncbi:unnamed protein product [Albugo candida]|uniref:Transcription initiation factor TFIID subunit 13 n=1 Tax=Albugo candida TaxID=65357 RepID=A0A024GE83_9STRA|nr:unnamed protein product [Albugo candida]|eukprot:CCI44974.1 unnamed protein product [Albugo candida]
MATELKKKLPAKARRRKGFEISQVGANCEREYTEYDDDDENVVGGDVNLLKRGDLSDSVRDMMIGFGDHMEPMEESIIVMQDFVVEYIQCMTKKAVDIATVKGKLDTECFIFPIRKDHETYERVKDLLQANGELKEVLNSGFDPADEKVY